jgi:hypothetical protein
MARAPTTLSFDAIIIEGGLIAPDMLGRIGAAKAGEQAEADYGLDPGVKIRDEIGFAFSMAETLWARFRQGGNVERFAEDLLRQVFGFRSLVTIAAPESEEREWPIRRAALDGRVPVVIAPPPAENSRRSGLDESHARFAEGNRRRSATLLVQEYLNAEDKALWGIATDGVTLRVLRDNSSLTRPAWIEADIARILGERMFADFSVLWLLLHESRFGRAGAAATDCPLERWREAARAEGVTARKRLRDGVEAALAALGGGFLKAADNSVLRQAITSGALTPQAYFQELLRLVYRFIFLFTAEDRNLLHPPGAPESARRLYADGYSVGRLRDRAVRRTAYDRHYDLYEGMKLIAGRLTSGEPNLALPALGGLFMPATTPHLDKARLANRDLLAALYRLAWLEVDRRRERVNWRDMETEELGSVYESLLELTPRLSEGATAFSFAEGAEAKGNARKTSGSYYTPDSLVELLLDSALDPVVDGAVKVHPGKEVEAILDLDVIDPACGSGHFLLAAARRLASRIAQFQSPGAPSAEDYRHALREVSRHCLYGVDRNPMAVELCKVALWIETLEPGKPLSYLDGRIRCGDSLIGVFDFEALEGGIPEEAYKALTGDSKEVSRYFSAWNRQVRKDKAAQAYVQHFKDQFGVLARTAASIDSMPEDDVAEVQRKAEADNTRRRTAGSQHLKVACDLFVAAFYLPKTGTVPDNRNIVTIPTSQHLGLALAGKGLYPPLEAHAMDVAARIAAFHWHLEFPEVFAKGGFDCVVGNPPWERMKLQEQEFFAARAPDIAAAANKAARERLIAALAAEGASDADRRLHADFQFAKREAEAASLFARSSGRYPLTGTGDVNTYALFAEHFTRLAADGGAVVEEPKPAYRSLAAMIADSGGKRRVEKKGASGRAGIIIPTGIATDATTSAFFGWLTDQKRLVQFLDFQTGMGLFNEIGHARFKFALMTVGASGTAEQAGVRLAFFLRQMSDLDQSERFFELSAAEIARLNPNTKTLATFRSQADAKLTAKIYGNAPVLIDEGKGEAGNPWGISFTRMFDMSNDSGCFRNAEQLTAAGAMRKGTEWLAPDTAATRDVQSGRYLPLYEAKMVHHFDHRWATYDDGSTGDDDARAFTLDEKADPACDIRPRYWVPAREVFLRIADLPEGLLAGLRKNDPARIALGVIHLLFSRWLWRDRPTGAGVFLAWREFVDHHPLARDLAPTALGLAANNPACLHPSGSDDIPAVAIDRIEEGPRGKIAWYAVDQGVLTAFLKQGERFDALPVGASPLVSEADALALAETLLERTSPRWLMGWRDICRSTDERTVIGAVFPICGVGNKLPIFSSDTIRSRKPLAPVFIALISAMTFDYAARQKMGGTTLNYFIMEQFSALPPSAFTEDDLDFIVPRVLELTYTSHSMKPFAEDLGYDGPPFAWDEERRAILRAELDARIARRYGLNQNDLDFILDPAEVMGADYPTETFRVLKENETKRFGEYRTRRLVLDAWKRDEARLAPVRLDPATLADGAWARPMLAAGAETGIMLAALLKAMERPQARRIVRLALVLAFDPPLLLPFLPTGDAAHWQRLVGGEAAVNIKGFVPRVDMPWGRAVDTLFACGGLLEDVAAGTWAPGSGLGRIDTEGWSEGRAAMVWKHLPQGDVQVVMDRLPDAYREWILSAAA